MSEKKKRGRVRVEPGQKRIRAMIAGKVVAESDDTVMVWEKPYYPTYYFPEADVRVDALVPSGHTKRSPSRSPAVAGSSSVMPASALTMSARAP